MAKEQPSRRTRPSRSALFRSGTFAFEDSLSADPRMTQCLRLARDAAKNDLTVLITGESGTGKTLLAQAIHNASARREGPFLMVNASALSEGLLESELFGHEKGAFTGAESLRRGKFELANGGTLVLDEIGDMSLQAQAKILHAVEYKQFPRVGGETMVNTDARIIAITNRDLNELVEAQRFRLDLLFRLRDITIEIPPLRERPNDIPIHCELFLNECQEKLGQASLGFSDAALAAMERHPWLGNLRELKSAIRRGLVVARKGVIEVEHLGLRETPPPAAAPDVADATLSADTDDDLTLATMEKQHIARVLEITAGNKRQAAKQLGISRSTLDRKLRGN